MRFLSKLLLISMSGLFTPYAFAEKNDKTAIEMGDVKIFSKPVKGERADQLTVLFFEAFQTYAQVLTEASRTGDLSKMEVIVEKGSSWYNALERYKELGEFKLPRAIGEIPYYPPAFFIYLVLQDQFQENKESIKVFKDGDEVEFNLPKVSIFLSEKDGVLKFKRFVCPELKTLFAQQLL